MIGRLHKPSLHSQSFVTYNITYALQQSLMSSSMLVHMPNTLRAEA